MAAQTIISSCSFACAVVVLCQRPIRTVLGLLPGLKNNYWPLMSAVRILAPARVQKRGV